MLSPAAALLYFHFCSYIRHAAQTRLIQEASVVAPSRTLPPSSCTTMRSQVRRDDTSSSIRYLTHVPYFGVEGAYGIRTIFVKLGVSTRRVLVFLGVIVKWVQRESAAGPAREMVLMIQLAPHTDPTWPSDGVSCIKYFFKYKTKLDI